MEFQAYSVFPCTQKPPMQVKEFQSATASSTFQQEDLEQAPVLLRDTASVPKSTMKSSSRSSNGAGTELADVSGEGSRPEEGRAWC